MGCVYLRKDDNFKSSVEGVTQGNTIFVIRYDYDLNNQTVTIPANCVLEFDGGSLSNGNVIGNDTCINAQIHKIFDNITLSGEWNIECIYPEWFGAIGGGDADNIDDADAIQAASNNAFNIGTTLLFAQTHYTIRKSIELKQHTVWKGVSRENNSLVGRNRPVLQPTIVCFGTNADSITQDGITFKVFLKEDGSGGPHRRIFENLNFECQGVSGTILFNVGFDGGGVRNCIVWECGIVFNQYILHCATIENNTFMSVGIHLVHGSITDSVISNNYISGYRMNNPVCIIGNLNHSKFINNFVDYFKFVITSGAGNTVIANNVFDICYRVINCNDNSIGNCTISNNIFANMKDCVYLRDSDGSYILDEHGEKIINTQMFVNADAEMRAIDPCCIFSAKVNNDYSIGLTYRGITNTSIIGNSFTERLVFNSPRNGVVIKNAYTTLAYDTSSIILGNPSGVVIPTQSYIDLYEYRDVNDMLSSEGCLYPFIHRQHMNEVVYAKPVNDVYKYYNLNGNIAINGNPNSTKRAKESGCIELFYKSNMRWHDGDFVFYNGDCTDFNSCSEFTGIKLDRREDVAYPLTFIFFDEQKNVISTDYVQKTLPMPFTFTVPANGAYFIAQSDYHNVLGYYDFYGIKPLTFGTFAQKPTKGIEVGYKYFCTDKQTTEGATNGIEIIYKGKDTTDPNNPVDVWVDALGRVIS